MATVILAAAGAAIGGSVGGGLAGISSVAIGRLVGATAGRLIDQSLMGGGSEVVETGRIERFRLTGSAEGADQARVFGRMRVAGQVIWATRFQEMVTETGGGKGGGIQPKTRSYSYSVSLAIALCEGEILGVGRIWADGVEISPDDLVLRVHRGASDQMADAKMEAVEGAGEVPAYRGTAYVVIEDLDLGPYGNRVPQFSFEVVRAAPEDTRCAGADYGRTVRAVALLPGTGEYALATTPVHYQLAPGERKSANVHSPAGGTDFGAALNALSAELPACGATSLVVSWFADDLRADVCSLRPKVENVELDGQNMPWFVSGLARSQAQEIAQIDGRPVYGGTPSDRAVIEALQRLDEHGQKVMYYPFVLMDQLAGNGLVDPWSGANDQPVLPWRGRITLSHAPGQIGSPDRTAAADMEVATFFGTAVAENFQIGVDGVAYTGPDEWSFRRFILHNAALCAVAGGVDAFCIGSEMRGLTQVRGATGFPAVQALRDLAQEVRTLLGPDVKLGYAADWSEYFGYHPQDGSGDVYFHLDPLWADENIDFVGIDNYMPLSDWRDTTGHTDGQDWSDIHDINYLKSNIEGGEGYDWFYHSDAARRAQLRSDISDGAHDEPWVFRNKDVRSWWSHDHHERINGVRQSEKTDWEPMSKPIWFTEIGCAAIDKGSNQPNKFLDAKSSESASPYFSNGARDDLIQQTYYQALSEYWSAPENNPVSPIFEAPMIDVDRMFAWAFDARPFPVFPNMRSVWSDGANYAKGHWINGRCANRTLASVVDEICHTAHVKNYDVSQLRGVVRGYVQSDAADARAVLQPLMLAYGFDAVERDGVLSFVMRGAGVAVALRADTFAVSDEFDGDWERTRASDAELAGRVRLNFVQAEGNFEAMSEEAILHDQATFSVGQSEIPLSLTRAEGRQTAERWLAEARVARDRLRLSLPPSQMDIGAGDVVQFPDDSGNCTDFRVDRVTQGAAQILETVRAEAAVYEPSEMEDDAPHDGGFVPPLPVQTLFLDVPLMTGSEVPHAPHLAIYGHPWPGAVSVYDADREDGYAFNLQSTRPAVVGLTENPLYAASAGRLDQGDALQVRILQGALQSVSLAEMLNGRNLAFVGDGQPDGWEALQFQDAELVDADRYLLQRRLRGQLGTEGAMRPVWPAGSWFVLMTGDLPQLDLQIRHRNYARNYRVGPSGRGYDDPSYQHYLEAFSGVGLRPYRPVHLTKSVAGSGDIGLSWVRQTRIDGDSWDGLDVPLGEEEERYLVRVMDGEFQIREAQVVAPFWTYTAAQQAEDGGGSGFCVQVSQVSAQFGAGAPAQLAL